MVHQRKKQNQVMVVLNEKQFSYCIKCRHIDFGRPQFVSYCIFTSYFDSDKGICTLYNVPWSEIFADPKKYCEGMKKQ